MFGMMLGIFAFHWIFLAKRFPTDIYVRLISWNAFGGVVFRLLEYSAEVRFPSNKPYGIWNSKYEPWYTTAN